MQAPLTPPGKALSALTDARQGTQSSRTANRGFPDNCSGHTRTYGWREIFQYVGPRLRRALKVIPSTLSWIWKQTGKQHGCFTVGIKGPLIPIPYPSWWIRTEWPTMSKDAGPTTSSGKTVPSNFRCRLSAKAAKVILAPSRGLKPKWSGSRADVSYGKP